MNDLTHRQQYDAAKALKAKFFGAPVSKPVIIPRSLPPRVIEAPSRPAPAIKVGRVRDILNVRSDSARAVVEAICRKYDITFGEMVGPRRSHHLVKARHEAMAAVWEARPDMSTIQIGKLFNRDHSSILYALGKLGKTLAYRDRLAAAEAARA